MVSLVVLPPEVAEGIILATSDPYVSAIRCMSIFSRVSVVFFFSAVAAGQSIWILMSMSFHFLIGSFPAYSLGLNSSNSDVLKCFHSTHPLLRPAYAAVNRSTLPRLVF